MCLLSKRYGECKVVTTFQYRALKVYVAVKKRLHVLLTLVLNREQCFTRCDRFTPGKIFLLHNKFTGPRS
jgi:hypothetical protein